MTAAIIIVLHLKTWAYLSFQAAWHVWQHYGCILHWVCHRLQAIYQSDLSHHGVSYSFKIILDGLMYIQQTHNICICKLKYAQGKNSRQIRFQPHPFSTAVSSSCSIIMNCNKRINDGLACSVSCGVLLLSALSVAQIESQKTPISAPPLTYQSYNCEF